jgi:S-adenosylmethionine:tRNA ribosyltransferase-isomerase
MADFFSLDSYDYHLPENLIAQQAHNPPDQCKLMTVNKTTWVVEHKIFSDLQTLLKPQSVLFFNNSKVVKARIPISHSYPDIKITNPQGKIIQLEGELFYLSPLDEDYYFLVRPWSKLKTGTKIQIGEFVLYIGENFEHGRKVHIEGKLFDLLEKYGQMPLPPYVSYAQEKVASYQPIFAKTPGSVASPTASLHFTKTLLDSFPSKEICTDFVTLHVWIWTFKSMTSSDIKQHEIHHETCEIDIELFSRIMNYKLNQQAIVAVGTTSCRTLESLPYLWLTIKDQLNSQCDEKTTTYWNNLSSHLDPSKSYISNAHISMEEGKIHFDCSLYILPGFVFSLIDQLITNFHLPKSSLMVLVASIMGYELMMQCYEDAIKNHYTFYSFGDAMRIY